MKSALPSKNDLNILTSDPEYEEGFEADLKEFDAPTERINDPAPVLFQSGYLTIKGYNKLTGQYILGFPNEEVREGLADSLYLWG